MEYFNGGDQSIAYAVQKYLFGRPVMEDSLWQHPEALRILRRQNPDGKWPYQGKKNIGRVNYDQHETYRNLGYLAEQYAFTNKHAAIAKAAGFLFSFQSEAGDLRGIYGNQYSPNYTAGIAELLIKAGYGNDPRLLKILEWLISSRQRDGGWAIPLRTHMHTLNAISDKKPTLEPDKNKPSSHMVTGVVLRALAAHPGYRYSKAAGQAGRLLASSLFNADRYPDRRSREYWFRFTFPFWFTDLISAMDSLSLLGFSKDEPEMAKALEWFVAHQKRNGGWKLKVLKGKNKDIASLWMALAICRIFRRFYDHAQI